VMVVKEALVYPRDTEGIQTFVVQANGERSAFDDSDEALAYAKKVVKRNASVAAVEAGAVDPQIILYVTREGSAFRVMAKALGNPRLSW